MNPDKKNLPLVIAAVVLAVCVLCSTVTSLVTLTAMRDLETALAPSLGETQENGVSIMDQYTIESTEHISAAYLNDSANQLSDRDQETLELAAAVLEELITEDMSPYEKELAVYDWMTHNLRYDTGVLTVIPQTEADADNPYGTLKYHNAVCVGYATTFRLFMEMLEIPCMVVHNESLYHTWNLVQLDGEWYHTDVYSAVYSGSYAGFNRNDDAMVSESWDRSFFPAATGLTYNYAIQNKVAVEDIYTIPALLREAIDQEQTALGLGFAVIDEPHAQIVEAMLDSVRAILESGELGSELWLSWNWLHVTGNEYVLALYVDGYDVSEPEAPAISQEDIDKVSDAVSEAFGTAPLDDESYDDWASDEITYDGEGQYIVKGVG